MFTPEQLIDALAVRLPDWRTSKTTMPGTDVVIGMVSRDAVDVMAMLTREGTADKVAVLFGVRDGSGMVEYEQWPIDVSHAVEQVADVVVAHATLLAKVGA